MYRLVFSEILFVSNAAITMVDRTEVLTVAAIQQHSTLELTKHDATASAPERNNATPPPRKDRDEDAPQESSVILV